MNLKSDDDPMQVFYFIVGFMAVGFLVMAAI